MPVEKAPETMLSNRESKLNSPREVKRLERIQREKGATPPSFRLISKGGLKWLACAAWGRESWAVHAFSTRLGTRGGALARGLNLGYTPGESRARVERNRAAFFKTIGARDFELAEIHQVHSTLIYRVRRGKHGAIEYLPSGYPAGEGQGPPQGDALMTDEPGILLAVRTADCVPVLLLDSKRRAVAAIHAGWKGMLGGIVEKTAGEMRRQFGSRPGDIFAAVGPSIGACCYEVGEEVAEHFRGGFADGECFVVSPELEEDSGGSAQKRAPYPPPFLSKAPPGHGPDPAPRPHLDLVAAARYQLLRAGVLSSRIAVAGLCTATRTDLFFSYRKEGNHTGRMMAVIGIRRRGSGKR
jgi:purine-nucleoside/S-methyl-5'-thioadenosine phosphorylase / adenosine deaminase